MAEVLISVVVPTWNRPEALAACLGGLVRSRLPQDRFEVVVVDDGSATPVDDVVAAHAQAIAVTLIRQPNRGPASARNAGAAEARGSLLAFTDDDCVVDPDWLPVLQREARTHPDHLLGGRVVNALEGNPFAQASQHLVSYLYGYAAEPPGEEPASSAVRWSRFFTSNNLAVPAATFQELGGFDETFPLAAGEDRDFCARWREAGLPDRYVPDAVVHHRHPLNASRFWRQHWNYGRGACHFHRARAARGGAGLRPEPLSFYLGMLRFPFGREGFGQALVQAGLLGMSQLANALGYFRERQRDGGKGSEG